MPEDILERGWSLTKRQKDRQNELVQLLIQRVFISGGLGRAAIEANSFLKKATSEIRALTEEDKEYDENAQKQAKIKSKITINSYSRGDAGAGVRKE